MITNSDNRKEGFEHWLTKIDNFISGYICLFEVIER